MASSFFAPLLVRRDGTTVQLKTVPIAQSQGGQFDERWLQDLLYRHPDALPISEIDDSYSGLIPLCIEMDTPAGPIDAVYITPKGRLALLEVKLWRNPEARRKVIGQILDYAKELTQWGYSRLDEAVKQARRKEKASDSFPDLVTLVAHRSGQALTEHHFIDAVSKSLAKGDFLLLIAGDGIRDGVGAIAQFLDRNGTMHFTFGLVECAIYESLDGDRFVQPRVLAQTTTIRRTIVMLEDNRIAEQDGVSGDDVPSSSEASPELQEARLKYQAFWTDLLARLRVEEQQPISKPAISTNQYFVMPEGSNGWVSAYLQQSKRNAGVYLTFGKGTIGERLFSALAGERQAIDSALGLPVQWTTDSDGRGSVLISRRFPGILLDDSRDEILAWFLDVIPRFVSVFRPRIEALLREP